MSRLQTNALRHLSAGSDNITLDASGRVLMPNQPSFSATGSASQTTYADGALLPFDTVYVDSPNYSVGNKRFTAPVAGKYMFYVNLYMYGANPGQFVLRKNGFQISSPQDTLPMGGGSIGADHISSMHAMLLLAANDYIDVAVRISSGDTSVYMKHSLFTGYLLG